MQKLTKKVKILLALGLAILAAGGIGSYAIQMTNPTRPPSFSGKVACQGDTIVIYETELSLELKYYQNPDHPASRQELLDNLIREEALYQMAIRAGYPAGDQRAWEVVEELMERNYYTSRDFKLYLKKYGLTRRQYFNALYFQLRRSDTYGAYTGSVGNIFNENPDFTSRREAESASNAYWQALINAYIDQDNIRYN